jgi:hypothetical protein
MAKTTYSTGVIVTSAWLNGAKEIRFDGQDLDWHYNPLGLESLILKGPNGLDSRYVTLGTDQPGLSSTGIYITGYPISGNKVFTGKVTFGFDPDQNPSIDDGNGTNAPLSYLTNAKYEYANGVYPPSIADKYQALSNSDIITKQILVDQFESLVIDNGTY